MTSREFIRREVHFTGRVQGVGFRYFVMNAAEELGLTGWVRNRRDGSVEVLAEGELELLKIKIISREPFATIENV